ncbi:hypothetical protein L6R52_04775 [Myxococcota bacterium]|nr:hypothetical protein [Myxococcota bacterium]
MIPVLVAAALFGACKKEAPTAETKTAAVAAGVPAGEVWAASAHVRVVDAMLGTVTSKLQLGRAVSGIVFSSDGLTAYVGASDGVHAIDAATKRVIAKLTERPVRQLAIDDAGAKLSVLEHEVVVLPDGTRDIRPFHLVTIDVASGKVVADEEIGQRILYAVAPTATRSGFVLAESGDLALARPGQALAEAQSLDVKKALGLGPDARFRVREVAAVRGDRAYVAVEAEPSQILELDLATGAARGLTLERTLSLRGLAVTADGKSLLVDAVDDLLLVDLGARALRGTLELGGAHTGLALTGDGKWAFLAQTIHENGGAITVVRLDTFTLHSKIHLDDLSPWALALRPGSSGYPAE